MSLWNKILLVLVFLASAVFFYTAARTVKTYQYWANLADRFEKKLNEVRAEVVSLETADHAHPRADKSIGVQQLRIDLGRVLANRGRIWAKCEKQKASMAPSGMMDVTVSSDETSANTITPNMLLYAFEEGDDQSPGKYLGEFHVKGVHEKQVQLDSTTQMVSSLAKNVAESKAPWVLYEMMPTDEHDALANLPEDQRKWVADEYLNDGQPVDASGKASQDPKDKKFERPLRDYLAIFRDCEMHRMLFADRWESTIRDLRYLDAAKKEGEAQLDQVEKENSRVAQELQRAKLELAAVANLYSSRQNMLNLFQSGVQAAIANNLKCAQEIARLQKDAADQIDRRTRTMAQFGPRTN